MGSLKRCCYEKRICLKIVLSYEPFVPFFVIIFIDTDVAAVITMLESHFLLCITQAKHRITES